MTEARGCLPAEAATAAAMLAKLPPERLNAAAPESKSLADIVADFAAAFDGLLTPEERTPEEEARIAAIRVRMDADRSIKRRDVQRREMAEMMAAREDAHAEGEEPPDSPAPPVAVLGPGLRPILPEPGEVLGAGVARAMQESRMTEAWAKFIRDQRRYIGSMLTKRTDARARGETPPEVSQHPANRFAPWWRQRVRPA